MKDSAVLIEKIYCIQAQIEKLYEKTNYDLAPLFFLEEENEELLKNNHELSFKNIIFYLYRLYYERAKINIEVMADYSHLVDKEKSDIVEIREVVHDFRTKFGHYLDLTLKRSKQINRRCALWFFKNISKEWPTIDDEWKVCEIILLEDTIQSLETIYNVLNRIVYEDEKRIYEQWKMKQKRDVPKYKKISILEEIKTLYNFPYDSTILYNKRQKQFDLVIEMLDFEDETKIEDYLFRAFEKIVLGIELFPCPLAGKEVLDSFGIEGKHLEHIMKNVMDYYSEHAHSTKEDLLEYVRTIIRE